LDKGVTKVKIKMKNLLLGLCVFMFSLTVNALPIELLTNGGFETGLTDWTVTDSGSGTFETTSALAPSNGVYTTVGASEGTSYAVSSQNGPGAHALTQTFFVPLDSILVTFSYDMFVQTNGLLAINPAGLDETATPNQHARVDLLTSGALAFDTGAGVLGNFYLGIDGTPTQPYTSYLFDITSLVTPGTSYQIRFAQADNQGNFNQGVDNVSLQATVQAQQVPVPATLALFGLGLAGLGWTRRRKV
jgi:hypothetical protein